MLKKDSLMSILKVVENQLVTKEDMDVLKAARIVEELLRECFEPKDRVRLQKALDLLYSSKLKVIKALEDTLKDSEAKGPGNSVRNSHSCP